MDAQHPLSSAQRRAESGWQWVPVRLDLHQKLTETPQGEVIVAGSGPESDREHILRMLRQQEVPALYSAENQQIELMLPVSADAAEPRVARADTSGQLSLGTGLEDFMEQILAFPGLEYASWQAGPGAHQATHAVVAARLPVHRLRRIARRLTPQTPIDLVPAGDEWSAAVSENSQLLIELIESLPEPALLLDTDGEHRALSIIPEEGDPLVLQWGPIRSSVHTYPADSPAHRLQAQVSGQASRGLREAARVAGVAALSERFGLDEASTRRLEQYTLDASGKYAPESVLQLLGLPDLPAKLLDGRRQIAELPGWERVEAGHDAAAAGSARVSGSGAPDAGLAQENRPGAPDADRPGRILKDSGRPRLPEHRLPASLLGGAAVGASAAIGWGLGRGVGAWLRRRGR